MSKLFDISKGGKVEMNATVLWIPEFKKIWNRDKEDGKPKAANEIAYIVFSEDYKSPYAGLPESKRDDSIRKACGFDKKWKPDKEIKDAIKKYKELLDSPALRALKGAEKALDISTEYFNNIDSSEALKALQVVDKLGPAIKTVALLKKQVEKEQLESKATRADREIGPFEL